MGLFNFRQNRNIRKYNKTVSKTDAIRIRKLQKKLQKLDGAEFNEAFDAELKKHAYSSGDPYDKWLYDSGIA